MIREVNEGDYTNLTALAIQVWLHTYAKYGLTQIGTTYFDLSGEKHENVVLAISGP